ncbi:MAG: phage portal protein [Catenulispora sp.]|nr:phage portal protein [Catenulispora sp.]
MTFLGRLFEQRSTIENPAVPLSSHAILESLGINHHNHTGVIVTEKTALRFGAVWRAVNLISALGGALPLHAYRSGTFERRSVRILDNPHPDLTDVEFWRLQYAHRCLWGNSYSLKLRNQVGQIRELHPLVPSRVKVCNDGSTDANPSGKVFIVDGNLDDPLTPADIFHIPGFGYDGVCGVSPIRLAATAIGLGLAAEEYGARLWSAGSMLGGVLQTEQRLDQATADRLKASWRSKVAGLSKAHEVAILDAGAKFQPITMPNNDAQFIESRDFQVSEVSRWFGVPPFLLNQTEKSTSWGTGLEQQATGFVKFDLHPLWLKPTEARITKELTGEGIYAKYKLEGLLRGDTAARAEFYNTMRNVGAFSANDIRELEDLPPVEGGDTYLEPLNMAPLGAPRDPNATGGTADAPNNAA